MVVKYVAMVVYGSAHHLRWTPPTPAPSRTTILLQDTADDAAQRPHADGQASQVDRLAVEVRLHVE